VNDPDSSVSANKIPNTCSKCHDSVILSERFGFITRRKITYLNSYHGLANIYGDTRVANCASCHGSHNIFPAIDSRSTINPQNLTKTCGRCHPGAGKNFTKGKVHLEAKPDSSKGVYYVRKFYTYFIGILMTLFLIHIIVDYSSWKKRQKKDLNNKEG